MKKCQNCGKNTTEVNVCKKCGFSGCGSCYHTECPKCKAGWSSQQKIKV